MTKPKHWSLYIQLLTPEYRSITPRRSK